MVNGAIRRDRVRVQGWWSRSRAAGKVRWWWWDELWNGLQRQPAFVPFRLDSGPADSNYLLIAVDRGLGAKVIARLWATVVVAARILWYGSCSKENRGVC